MNVDKNFNDIGNRRQRSLEARSEPGCGKPIRIVCANPDANECWSGESEDFAEGEQQWPLILKVRLDVTDEQLVAHLLHVASLFDRHKPRTA